MTTITEVAESCILKSRFQDEDELWERFQRACTKIGAFAIPGQLKSALNELKAQGRLIYVKGKGVKRP